MTFLHALNPFKSRAAAHRAMAMAALKSDTSLKHRLTRYNHHMTKARALEAFSAPVSHVPEVSLLDRLAALMAGGAT